MLCWSGEGPSLTLDVYGARSLPEGNERHSASELTIRLADADNSVPVSKCKYQDGLLFVG